VGLSRDVIAAAGLAMTDEVGLEGLSMRKLGSVLGVEAMSLYHYVENKGDLLDAILDILFQGMDMPFEVPAEDWETAIRMGLTALNDTLIRHPAALEIIISRPVRSGHAFKTLMWAYGRFAAVGLDPQNAHKAFHFATSFVAGHRALKLGSVAAEAAQYAPDTSCGQSSGVTQFVSQRDGVSESDEFNAGLDAVIHGLRATFKLP